MWICLSLVLESKIYPLSVLLHIAMKNLLLPCLGISATDHVVDCYVLCPNHRNCIRQANGMHVFVKPSVPCRVTYCSTQPKKSFSTLFVREMLSITKIQSYIENGRMKRGVLPEHIISLMRSTINMFLQYYVLPSIPPPRLIHSKTQVKCFLIIIK